MKDIPRLLFSPIEAARMLNVDIRVFRALVEAGEIKYVLVRERKKFTLADLDEYIKRNTGAECPSIKNRAPRSGRSTSKSEVIEFAAPRGLLQRQRQNSLRQPSDAGL